MPLAPSTGGIQGFPPHARACTPVSSVGVLGRASRSRVLISPGGPRSSSTQRRHRSINSPGYCRSHIEVQDSGMRARSRGRRSEAWRKGGPVSLSGLWAESKVRRQVQVTKAPESCHRPCYLMKFLPQRCHQARSDEPRHSQCTSRGCPRHAVSRSGPLCQPFGLHRGSRQHYRSEGMHETRSPVFGTTRRVRSPRAHTRLSSMEVSVCRKHTSSPPQSKIARERETD